MTSQTMKNTFTYVVFCRTSLIQILDLSVKTKKLNTISQKNSISSEGIWLHLNLGFTEMQFLTTKK